MRLLVDTRLLLWAAQGADRLPIEARQAMADARNELWFSAASIWEVAIKASLGRDDFRVHPRMLRSALRGAGYRELAVNADHAATIAELEPHHRDPFGRLLVAQVRVEAMTLLTHDAELASYGAFVRMV